MQPDEAGELETVEEKITSLITYRSGLVKGIRNLRQRRMDLAREIRDLSASVRSEREALEKSYEMVKVCREKRKGILVKISELKRRMYESEADLRKFERQASYDQGEVLTKKLQAIEWKIEAEKHTREEEKQLIELVKESEAKLVMWKKAYVKRQGLTSLLDEMDGLKGELDEVAQVRREVEADITARKSRLTPSVKAREQIFDEMGDLEQDIAELEQNIASTDGQLEELRRRRREIVQSRRAREAELFKMKERGMLERAVAEAREKMRRGEKLTFEELRLALKEDEADPASG